VLAVDISGSAGFGSGRVTLRERAAEVAAALAVSALKAGDKVGLLLFTDREELWVPPKKGRRHVLRLIRDVLEHPPVAKRTAFATPMRRLARALKRRAMVFVVSDFLAGPEGDDAMAAAVGVPHPKWDERPLLLVVLRPGQVAEPAALRDHVAARVARWWVPDEVRIVDSLPIGPTGKVLKRELRAGLAET
jgi:uncharacterized protein (DUF58 family)